MKTDFNQAITQAVIEKGGDPSNIDILSQTEIAKYAGIIGKQIKKKQDEGENPKYRVKPTNYLLGSCKHFAHTNKEVKDGIGFITEAPDISLEKTIELVHISAKTKDGILKEMHDRGYAPVESPYLLTLMIEQPQLAGPRCSITTIDDGNDFGTNQYINFFVRANATGTCLGLIKPNITFGRNWKFAVEKIAKEDSTESELEKVDATVSKKDDKKKKGIFSFLKK